MTTPTTLGEAIDRIRTIESMMKIYDTILAPVRYRELGGELELENPLVTTERFVVPESAWSAVKAEVEARCEALAAEKAALEVMPFTAYFVSESRGLVEVDVPVARPAKERRRRALPALQPVPAEPAARQDQVAA